MKATKYQFLKGVLGEEGAKALTKAAERSSALENVLLPRTIVAWLALASHDGSFEGSLPGVENTYLQFSKSEEEYTGSIGIEGQVYSFDSASVYHIASSVAVALGLDHEAVDSRLRPVDLAKLGKTIDILSKARVVVESLRKAEAPGPAHAPTQQTGPAVAQVPTLQPRTPKVATTAKKPPKLPTVPGAATPKLPSVKVTKAESEVACPDCGRAQFIAGRFTGCFCLMILSKSVRSTPAEDGFVMEFSGDWDRDAVSVLLKAMGKL